MYNIYKSGELTHMAKALFKEEREIKRLAQLDFMEKSLINISSKGAENLYEAIQLYILLWTVMCLEQAAFGTALFGLVACGIFKNAKEAQQLVQYKE